MAYKNTDNKPGAKFGREYCLEYGCVPDEKGICDRCNASRVGYLVPPKKEYTVVFEVEAKGHDEVEAAKNALEILKGVKSGDSIRADITEGQFTMQDVGTLTHFKSVEWEVE